MNNDKKRPKLIWIIFIYMVLGGIYGLYSFYNISTGSIQLPEGFIKPSGVFYYLNAIIIFPLWILTAFLLFFRKEVAKWFFIGLLVYSILNSIDTSIYTTLPEQYHTIVVIAEIISLIIFALVTRYTFKLKEKEYYIIASSKGYNKN